MAHVAGTLKPSTYIHCLIDTGGAHKMDTESQALESGDVVVVTRVTESTGSVLASAGAHGVVLRPQGAAWVVQLDSGQQLLILATDLEKWNPTPH